MNRSRRTPLALVASLGCGLAACVGPARQQPGTVPSAGSVAPVRRPVPPVAVSDARGRVVALAPSGDPTGATDAAALQHAFTGATPGTTIELGAGDHYLGRALVAQGFVGTLRGAGMEATTVHVTGTIRHFTAAERDCRGTRIDGSLHSRPTPATPLPFALTFVGGDLTLSDLTFTTVPGARSEFCIFQQAVTAIPGFVLITGPATGSRVLRVRFTGHAGSFEGYDVLQGLYHEGVIHGGRDDAPRPVTGRHLVEGCDFEHLFAGSSVTNSAASFVVEYRHNTYGVDAGKALPLLEGLEVWSSAGQVRFEHNEVRSAGWGIAVVQGILEKLGIALHTGPLHLLVAGNRIVAGPGAVDAIELTDFHPALFGVHALFVEVRGNHLVLHGARYGIIGSGLEGARFVGNTFEGHVIRDGFDLGGPAPTSAYGLSFPTATYPTVGCRLQGNDLTHLSAGRHPVWLGPHARGCVVVGRAKVTDQGHGNRVVRAPRGP